MIMLNCFDGVDEERCDNNKDKKSVKPFFLIIFDNQIKMLNKNFIINLKFKLLHNTFFVILF